MEYTVLVYTAVESTLIEGIDRYIGWTAVILHNPHVCTIQQNRDYVDIVKLNLGP